MDNSIKEEIIFKELSERDLLNNKNTLLDLIIKVLNASFDNIENINEHSEEIYENMLKYRKNNTAILFGALVNKTIVAFIWAHKKEILGKNLIHISYLSVDSKYSSLGIGTKLFNLVEKNAIENNILKIEFMTSIANKATMSFHEKNGYVTNRVLFEKELKE